MRKAQQSDFSDIVYMIFNFVITDRIMRPTIRVYAKFDIVPVLKDLEFGQIFVLLSWVVSIVWISLSFVLALLEKNTNENVTVPIVTECFAVTLAYYMYQAFLKNSRNKYGIDASGVPYKFKTKLDGLIPQEGEDEHHDTD